MTQTEIILPLAAGIAGGLIGGLVSLWIIAKWEWLRR